MLEAPGHELGAAVDLEPFYWTTVAGIVPVMTGVILIAMRAS